jgi:hypothetical protein
LARRWCASIDAAVWRPTELNCVLDAETVVLERRAADGLALAMLDLRSKPWFSAG